MEIFRQLQIQRRDRSNSSSDQHSGLSCQPNTTSSSQPSSGSDSRSDHTGSSGNDSVHPRTNPNSILHASNTLIVRTRSNKLVKSKAFCLKPGEESACLQSEDITSVKKKTFKSNSSITKLANEKWNSNNCSTASNPVGGKTEYTIEACIESAEDAKYSISETLSSKTFLDTKFVHESNVHFNFPDTSLANGIKELMATYPACENIELDDLGLSQSSIFSKIVKQENIEYIVESTIPPLELREDEDEEFEDYLDGLKNLFSDSQDED